MANTQMNQLEHDTCIVISMIGCSVGLPLYLTMI